MLSARRDALRRLAQTARHCRSLGAGARHFALGRAPNHLDLAGLNGLESVFAEPAFRVRVSATTLFPGERRERDGGTQSRLRRCALRVKGNYSAFLEARLYLHAQKSAESLENRVHTELEWLRRGPKARATKAKARIDKAHEMIGNSRR